MTQLYTSVAAGTAATFMAITLMLLRLNLAGRRPVVALMRRWIATDTPTSGIVLILISTIAAYSFAHIPAYEPSEPIGVSASSTSTSSRERTVHDADTSLPADQTALEALRAYATKIDTNVSSVASTSTAPESATLPDVTSMITKLVARLEKEPDDVRGWKMLGWSLLNTERPEEAAQAYETALKLAPNDMEIRKGLEAAKAAQPVPAGTPTSTPATPASVNREPRARND